MECTLATAALTVFRSPATTSTSSRDVADDGADGAAATSCKGNDNLLVPVDSDAASPFPASPGLPRSPHEASLTGWSGSGWRPDVCVTDDADSGADIDPEVAKGNENAATLATAAMA